MRKKKKIPVLLFILLIPAMLAFAVLFRTALQYRPDIVYYEPEAPRIDPDDWRVMLVNADNPLPEGYEVSLLTLDNGQCVDERIYPELQEMFNEARRQGIDLYVRSGWRSYEAQQRVMDEKVASYVSQGYSEEEALRLAADWVAEPGTSEHQTGLAVDINSSDTSNSLRTYNWLVSHAHEYGFIQRYPEEKSSLTGIGYEPWHYRYVGKEAALYMFETGMCLEEYQSSQR